MSPVQGKIDKEEEIKLMMDAFGIGEVEARFIWGIEHGEIKGDVIELGPDGELPPDLAQD